MLHLLHWYLCWCLHQSYHTKQNPTEDKTKYQFTNTHYRIQNEEFQGKTGYFQFGYTEGEEKEEEEEDLFVCLVGFLTS